MQEAYRRVAVGVWSEIKVNKVGGVLMKKLSEAKILMLFSECSLNKTWDNEYDSCWNLL